MSQGPGLIVVTAEAGIATAVSEAVEASHALAMGQVCGDMASLTQQLERASAAVVVVDIDPNPEQMLGELNKVTNRFPEVRFVVVSGIMRHEWILAAMQAGARHFLEKSSIKIELPEVIERITPNGWAGRRVGGALITVLSAGGGSGATTLAVNLANELRLAGERPTLVVDMDCCYGSAALHLGAEGMYGLAEVLRGDRAIDAELIRSTVVHRADGPDLLMNPAALHPAEPAQLDFSLLPRMFWACRENYAYTVIDAPRLSIDTASEMARSSMATVLVFQSNLRDLRAARAMLTALLQRGVSVDRILPVANRHRRRYGMIGLSDAQRTLSERRIGTLSNDYMAAQKALNYGQLLAECAARSSLRRDIRSLAASLVEAHRGNHAVKEW